MAMVMIPKIERHRLKYDLWALVVQPDGSEQLRIIKAGNTIETDGTTAGDDVHLRILGTSAWAHRLDLAAAID